VIKQTIQTDFCRSGGRRSCSWGSWRRCCYNE